MKVNRNELLQVLSAARPALAKKEIIEEAVRFIFFGDILATYNDAICISVPFKTDFTCSVHGEELYKILSSIKDDEVDLKVEDNQLKITAKKTKVGMTTIVGEKERVSTLIEKLTADTKKKGFWKKLPKDFITGVSLCMFSASKDMTTGVRCCVAIKDNTIYSTDNLRISKYIMSENTEEMLIPARDVVELIKYSVVKFGISEGWVHFITNDGVMFNCRTMSGEYPFTSIARFFQAPRNEINVPSTVREIMLAAAVVAEGDVSVAKIVEVSIEKGKLLCKSEDKGKKWMENEVDIEGYEGDKVTFYINPIFFSQILEKSTSLYLIQGEEFPDKAVFTNDNFTHILALPA